LNSDKAGLLVTGGDIPPFLALESRMTEFSFICAADSGLDAVRAWGLEPDLVVGDMDSLSDPAILGQYRNVRTFPCDKDDTDTEIGIRELRNRGYGRVVVAGGGGGRLDHLLALRALLERDDGPDEWLTAAERIVRIRVATSFVVKPGTTVSVFPLGDGASGMKSCGLKWPLDGLSWDRGHFGVSNMATDATVFIEPGARPLFVILPIL
jgi:thiamine pyrophosphokinase